MNSSNLFIGNIVSFIDDSLFIKLIIIKEQAKLYKYEKNYIDVTEIDEDNISEYIEEILNKNDKTKILNALPVYKNFVDESSLVPYKNLIKQLTR